MSVKDDQGDANLSAALSGDPSLYGTEATREQIETLGGEYDDDLDGFVPTPESRGDFVDDDERPTAADTGSKGEEEETDDSSEEEEDSEEEEVEAEEEADEEEAEEAEEAEEEEETDEGKKPKKQENRIPKSRFDEVNARRKAAEDRIRELEAQIAAKEKGSQQEYDFEAAEEEYAQLLLDGDVKAAIAKRKEINTAQEAVWEARQVEKAASTVTAREVERELDVLVARYEREYDEFNPESDAFSEDLIDEVQAMFDGYLRRRPELSPAEAFELATDNVVRLYGLERLGDTKGEPREDPKSKSKGKTVRKAKKDTKRKVELAKKAPKNPAKAGGAGDSGGQVDEIDINQLSDEEWDALPESTKRRLRGDYI